MSSFDSPLLTMYGVVGFGSLLLEEPKTLNDVDEMRARTRDNDKKQTTHHNLTVGVPKVCSTCGKRLEQKTSKHVSRAQFPLLSALQ
jgi:hypothetical protein